MNGFTINAVAITNRKPGMEVELAPAGTFTPYTAAFTGSISLPFVIFEDKTCTAIMVNSTRIDLVTKDSGSTSSARAFEMKRYLSSIHL